MALLGNIAQEPNFTMLANPARVLVAQKKFVAIPPECRCRLWIRGLSFCAACPELCAVANAPTS